NFHAFTPQIQPKIKEIAHQRRNDKNVLRLGSISSLILHAPFVRVYAIVLEGVFVEVDPRGDVVKSIFFDDTRVLPMSFQ
ncbi:MAG: hypothetical protein KKC03_13710, partial [Bacteroidetes bacterium]|nr:hypothetical protein [Bacteroidota bacterium]